jgi:hypothetical protein
VPALMVVGVLKRARELFKNEILKKNKKRWCGLVTYGAV